MNLSAKLQMPRTRVLKAKERAPRIMKTEMGTGRGLGIRVCEVEEGRGGGRNGYGLDISATVWAGVKLESWPPHSLLWP